jgi:hypothetical protein
VCERVVTMHALTCRVLAFNYFDAALSPDACIVLSRAGA